MSDTIQIRQTSEKELLIEQLKKVPIVQIACEKSGVARATYYRWRESDPEFRKLTDDALSDSIEIINDMAEAHLLAAIQEGEMGAITYWLRHRHKAYSTKVEIEGSINTTYELTEEQKELLNKAIGLIFKEENES